MTACRFAADCTHEGKHLVRIDGVGDRRVCDAHLRWMTDMGMGFRVLPDNLVVPAWRQRDLASDKTGRLVA